MMANIANATSAYLSTGSGNSVQFYDKSNVWKPCNVTMINGFTQSFAPNLKYSISSNGNLNLLGTVYVPSIDSSNSFNNGFVSQMVIYPINIKIPGVNINSNVPWYVTTKNANSSGQAFVLAPDGNGGVNVKIDGNVSDARVQANQAIPVDTWYAPNSQFTITN